MSRGSRDVADDFAEGVLSIQQAWRTRENEITVLQEALEEKTLEIKTLESRNVALESEVVNFRRRLQQAESENSELKAALRQLEQTQFKFESVKRSILTTLQGAESEEDSKISPSPHNTSNLSTYSGLVTSTPNTRDPGKPISPGKTVDGKKFFSATRKRLNYEAFSDFLAYIKKMNNREISKEQVLEEVKPVFGTGNEDLYEDFVLLLSKKH